MRSTKPEIQVSFSEKSEQALEHIDKFPGGEISSLEDTQKQYGVVVWCKYTACIHNREIKNLQRTSGTLLKRRGYVPLNEQEAIWSGICTRNEIGMNYTDTRTSSGRQIKVPSCFVSATNKTGHMDFSSLLQADGSPYGGNIDSQHAPDMNVL